MKNSNKNSNSEDEDDYGMDYQSTLMYGHYTEDLGEYAKQEAKRIKILHEIQKNEDREKELTTNTTRCTIFKTISWLWRKTIVKLGEDWVFLALLGIIMAILSFIVDRGIETLTNTRLLVYRDLVFYPYLQYVTWVSMAVSMVLFAAGFAHLVAPQCVGSGIPEVKTILRGVHLKEYLTFKTLIAKVIGLIAALGSGMPLGKEGPFIHIANIVAHLLSKCLTSFRGIYTNESRKSDMIGAASAVGIGACFGAPVGGVLLGIEVTTSYFAIRDYWRAFFSAVCGAVFFRLMVYWFENTNTVTSLFPTNFNWDFPYNSFELIIFAAIGVIGGFLGAFFVLIHKKYVLFIRSNSCVKFVCQYNRFIYPGVLAFIVGSLTFPLGSGHYVAGELSYHEQVYDLLSNFTWTNGNLTAKQMEIVDNWSTSNSGVFSHLAAYFFYSYFMSLVCYTMPVPAGIFIPSIKIGAILGRIIGEALHIWFPSGIGFYGNLTPIIPGGYAVVCSAAFAGAVTHTVSVGVMILEMTGQITHIVPVMIAVLISNALASKLQPSIYDSMILIKKLPYLPDFLPSSSTMYNIFVENFMIRDVKFIWKGMTFKDLKHILKENKSLTSFPLVESYQHMILLGSIHRYELIKLIDNHVGKEKRLKVVETREKQRLVNEKLYSNSKSKNISELTDSTRLQRFENNDNALKSLLKKNHNNYSGLAILPVKSILKKSTSNGSSINSSQTSVTKSNSRIFLAFESVSKKIATLPNASPDPETGSPDASTAYKKVHLPSENLFDMSLEEQKRWQAYELSKVVDFDSEHINIDPAPFQLVEKTSILKVHSMFSMLKMKHAYVTKIGKLVGVVGLIELRKAIEDINNGTLIPKIIPQPQTNMDYERLNADDDYESKVDMTIRSLDSGLSPSSDCSSESLCTK